MAWVSIINGNGTVRETHVVPVRDNVYEYAIRLEAQAKRDGRSQTYIIDDGKNPPRPATGDQRPGACLPLPKATMTTPPTRKPKRPADVIGNAIRVAQIATGEAVEEYEDEPETPKDEDAVRMGARGGAARAAKLSPERRAEIAKKAAESRWKK